MSKTKEDQIKEIDEQVTQENTKKKEVKSRKMSIRAFHGCVFLFRAKNKNKHQRHTIRRGTTKKPKSKKKQNEDDSVW